MLLALLIAAISSASIPLDLAERAFEDARIASDDDGGRLWGRALYGPILFGDPKTRTVVTNARDAAGTLTAAGNVFTGKLEDSFILANTAKEWNGTMWTIVSWNFISSRSVPRRRLLMHECFHRIQRELGFPPADPPNPHLDTLDGRYWLILELRALAAALRSDGNDRIKAISDAAAFRAKRRVVFSDAAIAERGLENNEGLAEYTGWALRGTTDRESRIMLAENLTSLDPNTTFARSFAYETGPAYGLLLDVLASGWTRRYTAGDDLADTLAAAAKVTPSADAADAASRRYAGPALREAEVRRDTETRKRIARYRALLVDGPVIELPMASAQYGFDPLTVITIPGAGSAYPTLEVTAAWGTLSAKTGALITSDFTRIIVPAALKDSGNLTLNTGWQIVPGARAGDFRVTR